MRRAVKSTLGEERMKRIIPFFVVVLATVLVVGCSSPTPSAAQQPAQPAATEPIVTTEPTSQSVPTESVPLTGGTQVDITLADNTIDATTTTFQAGVSYIFAITNAGRHAHNFNINPPVSVTGSLEGSLNSALFVVPQEQLAPGQTATVEFTFP